MFAFLAMIFIPLFILAKIIEFVQEVWQTAQGKIVLVGVPVLSAIILIVKESKDAKAKAERNAQMKQLMSRVEVESGRHSYIIEENDYKRGNAKENAYRKSFKLKLLEVFGNCCAKCGAQDNGIDIDHFFFSKNAGGCFLMRNKDGFLVNNAIPLCRTCNRSKSDQDYKSFFSPTELLKIFTINLVMTEYINNKSVLDEEGQVVKANRKRA